MGASAGAWLEVAVRLRHLKTSVASAVECGGAGRDAFVPPISRYPNSGMIFFRVDPFSVPKCTVAAKVLPLELSKSSM